MPQTPAVAPAPRHNVGYFKIGYRRAGACPVMFRNAFDYFSAPKRDIALAAARAACKRLAYTDATYFLREYAPGGTKRRDLTIAKEVA